MSAGVIVLGAAVVLLVGCLVLAVIAWRRVDRIYLRPGRVRRP